MQIDRIDGLVGSIAVKIPCVAATTANITLSGTQTVDGIAVVANDRVLVKNQTTASENGIYDVSSTAWSRAIDFNGTRDIAQGTAVRIISGTVSGQYFYEVTTEDPLIGTTDIAFALVNFPVTTTSYIATLLDDTTSTEARATLEINEVYRGTAGGTADIITLTATPTLTALKNGTILFATALLANATTTPTLNVDSLGAKTIVKEGNQALLIGDIARADHELILRYDSGNDVWELLNPPHHLHYKFKGALVYNSSNETITTSTYTHLSFDSESYDTDTTHDTVTNNDRLTVPTGVTKIRLSGSVEWGASAIGQRIAGISKNDDTTTPTSVIGLPRVSHDAAASLNTNQTFSSAPLTVTEGDFFSLYVWHNVGSDSSIISSTLRTFFAMEIIE